MSVLVKDEPYNGFAKTVPDRICRDFSSFRPDWEGAEMMNPDVSIQHKRKHSTPVRSGQPVSENISGIQPTTQYELQPILPLPVTHAKMIVVTTVAMHVQATVDALISSIKRRCIDRCRIHRNRINRRGVRSRSVVSRYWHHRSIVTRVVRNCCDGKFHDRIRRCWNHVGRLIRHNRCRKDNRPWSIIEVICLSRTQRGSG